MIIHQTVFLCKTQTPRITSYNVCYTKLLRDEGSKEAINKIEDRVDKFMDTELKNKKMIKDPEHIKMIEQLKKYWDRLFADPVEIDTSCGRISIQPQRTNNVMERLFREIKRDYRRKTGNNSMGRKLGAMNANTLLISYNFV